MINPNIPSPKKVAENARKVAILCAGCLALSGNPVTTPNALADDSPAMEYNIKGANKYHMTDVEVGEIIEAREEACASIFSSYSECWVGSGLSPNLWTQGLIKFTPIIPSPDSPNEGINNIQFTRVPLFVPAQEK